MNAFDRYARRALAGLPRRDRAVAREELEAHFRERSQQLCERGLALDAAERQTLRELGSPARANIAWQEVTMMGVRGRMLLLAVGALAVGLTLWARTLPVERVPAQRIDAAAVTNTAGHAVTFDVNLEALSKPFESAGVTLAPEADGLRISASGRETTLPIDGDQVRLVKDTLWINIYALFGALEGIDVRVALEPDLDRFRFRINDTPLQFDLDAAAVRSWNAFAFTRWSGRAISSETIGGGQPSGQVTGMDAALAGRVIAASVCREGSNSASVALAVVDTEGRFLLTLPAGDFPVVRRGSGPCRGPSIVLGSRTSVWNGSVTESYAPYAINQSVVTVVAGASTPLR